MPIYLVPIQQSNYPYHCTSSPCTLEREVGSGGDTYVRLSSPSFLRNFEVLTPAAT